VDALQVRRGERTIASMDDKTLELLEFDAVRRMVVAYAGSSLGKELAARIRPSTVPRQVAAWLETTTQLASALVTEGRVPLGGVHDIRPAVKRAAPEDAMLDGEELVPIVETLAATGPLREYLQRTPPTAARLHALAQRITDFSALAKRIGGVLGPEGEVLDHASERLASLRYRIEELRERIVNRMRGLARDPEMRVALQYPRPTLHGDRYVLPVKQTHRAWIQGIVHRTSDSGATLFVEPTAVCEMSNDLISILEDERQEVRRVLRELTGLVGQEVPVILETIRALAIVDLTTAKAHFSRDYEMVEPRVNDDGVVRLMQARHPLLARIQRDTDGARPVVPIDVNLGETFRTLVVTGPNTGGKTVALKTVGLLCLMAQSGLHVPAAPGSTVPIFTSIWVDVGDEQSIAQNLSTFSSHMTRIIYILRHTDERSLVILDELGAGTDPAEGAALGRAILEELDRRGARVVASTHIGELKKYAYQCARASNGSVEFDPKTLRPTYRLMIGVPGSSNALAVVRHLGLSEEIVGRARGYLSEPAKALADEIEAMHEVRRAVEESRQEAAALAERNETLRRQYEGQLQELEGRIEHQRRLEEAREALAVGDVVRVPSFDAEGEVVRVNRPRREVVVRLPVADVTVSFNQTEPRLDEAPAEDTDA